MRRTKMAFLFALLALVLVGSLATGGSSSPIVTVAPAPVPQTGQRIQYRGADDGLLQMGIEWDAATRFTNNGDGTVTDNLTGLIWTRVASCPELGTNGTTWTHALDLLADRFRDGNCGLSDGSVPGDWRLPNVRELQSLVDYGERGRALPDGHPFLEVRTLYWTSTTSLHNAALLAWTVDFFNGEVEYRDKGVSNYVWPVKGEGITALYQYMPLVVEDGL